MPCFQASRQSCRRFFNSLALSIPGLQYAPLDVFRSFMRCFNFIAVVRGHLFIYSRIASSTAASGNLLWQVIPDKRLLDFLALPALQATRLPVCCLFPSIVPVFVFGTFGRGLYTVFSIAGRARVYSRARLAFYYSVSATVFEKWKKGIFRAAAFLRRDQVFPRALQFSICTYLSCCRFPPVSELRSGFL